MMKKTSSPKKKKKRSSYWTLLIALLGFMLLSPSGWAQRVKIKDLADVRGNRANQLIGIGLVVGLQNSGDSKKSINTNKAIASLFSKLGMRTTPEEVLPQSVAAVIVTGELPPFAKIGGRIDVKLSTIGDAKSLAGGTLLQTSLKAGDGQVYAVAQGAVATGQATGSANQVLTTALVPRGAFIEREFVPTVVSSNAIELALRQADFTTNSRMVDRINEELKGFFAESLDPGSIRVNIPQQYRERTIEFISMIEQMDVEPSHKALVVINERTGTVVMGGDVVIQKVVISHGDLSIQINGDKGQGGKGAREAIVNIGGATVGDLVASLNALGMKPADLVGILQAIHTAGALQAELQFM